jgi:galactose oxidase-like protein/SprB-like repeat protein
MSSHAPPPASDAIRAAESPVAPRPLAAPPTSFWTRLSANGGPTTNLTFISVAYDPADGYTLMFGGMDTSTFIPVNSTFKYTAGHWSLLAPPNSPPPVSEASMAYDPVLGGVVLFGGFTASFSTGETWLYKAGNWTEVALTGPQPAPRAGASMVYDAADGYLVMFGGGDSTTFPYSNFNDTWKLTANATWVQLHPKGTHPACTASAADYDPVARVVYDFSGYYYNQTTVQADCAATTWEYAAGVWTNITEPGAPAQRSAAAFTFDPALNASILYGGMNYTNFGAEYDDVWELSNGNWTELNTTAPPAAEASSALTYDPSSGFLLLTEALEPFVGVTSIHAAVWLFDDFSVGAVSSSPSTLKPEVGMALGFHVAIPSSGATYSFGWSGVPGCTPATNATWRCTLHSTGPTLVNANATNGYGLSLNATPLSLEVLPALATPILSISPSSIEPNGTATLSLAGSGGTTPYTYAWSGLPPGCANLAVANLTCSPSESGTYATIVGNVTDANGVTRHSAAGSLTVFGVLGLSALLAHPGAVDIGRSTTLSVAAHGGSGAYTYTWGGLPAGCASSDSAAFPCTPSMSGTYALNVTVADSIGGEAIATGTLVVAPYPAVSLSVNPSVVDAGEPMNLTASPTGGVGNFSFAFTGLPPGCSAGTHPIVQCSPSTAGPYVLAVTATDSDGVAVQSSPLALTIAGSLGLGAVVTPLPVTVGTAVTISLRSSGGSGPYVYSYSGLPPGCAPQNTSALTCTPSAPGNYTVIGYVRDASGTVRSTTFYIVVQAPTKSTSSSTWLFAGAGAAVVLAAIAALLLLRRRRGRTDASSEEAPSEEPAEDPGVDEAPP